MLLIQMNCAGVRVAGCVDTRILITDDDLLLNHRKTTTAEIQQTVLIVDQK